MTSILLLLLVLYSAHLEEKDMVLESKLAVVKLKPNGAAVYTFCLGGHCWGSMSPPRPHQGDLFPNWLARPSRDPSLPHCPYWDHMVLKASGIISGQPPRIGTVPNLGIRQRSADLGKGFI